MAIVLGIDGCPDGWCGVLIEVRGERLTVRPPRLFPAFDQVLASDAEIIGIDIPIGLVDRPGGRSCDRHARGLLGAPRASSVFSAPSRGVLYHAGVQRFFSGDALTPHEMKDLYRRASDVNEELTGKRLSQQAFHISKKVREVDLLMTRALQGRVREVHPEVCFQALNGRQAMRSNKKKRHGVAERWALLRHKLPSLPKIPVVPADFGGRCGIDDYIDATVAAWTALCILRGDAQRIPDPPEAGENGLRMEIWFPAR